MTAREACRLVLPTGRQDLLPAPGLEQQHGAHIERRDRIELDRDGARALLHRDLDMLGPDPDQAGPGRGHREARIEQLDRAVLGMRRVEVDRGIAEQPGDVAAYRLGVEPGRLVDLDEAAIHQHGDPMAQRHGLLVVLGDVEHGGIEGLEHARQLEAHLVAQLGIDIAQGIVEQQHRGAGCQRAGERGALLLPVGERARQVAQHMLDLQQRRHLLDPPGHLGSAQAARAQRARDVVERAHVRIEREVLERHADVAILGRQHGHGLVADPDRAGIGLVDAGDQAQQHGLAAAGRAEHHHGLALLDRERDVIQDGLAAKPLGEGFERQVAHRLSP